jgi:hypothetical protein
VIARRYATVKKTVGRTIGDARSTQGCRVIAAGFPGGQTEGRKMATKGHRRDGKKIHQQPSKDEMDKEITEIRSRKEDFALQMQRDARSHWVYEWPMRMKVKWLVREMLARRQRRLIRGWLRYAESLRNDEEDMVQVCEPETGRNLNDDEDELRSLEELRDCHVCRDCQERRTKISNCQEGNEMRSLWDLIDCQEDNREISCCQEGNEVRSLRGLIDCQEGRTENSNCQVGNKMISEDLIDCQGGSKEIPYCQEGKGEKMSSEMNSYQQGQMTEEKDQKDILIIGGIQIFLPGSPIEVRVCVADVAATERQLAETIKEEEELEQISKAAQEEEGNEHSEEWLKCFS